MPDMGVLLRCGTAVAIRFLAANLGRGAAAAMHASLISVFPTARQSLCAHTPSCTEPRHCAPRRRGEIDARAGRDDAGRIDGAVAAVIVRLDVVEPHCLGDARYLIERAQKIPQLGKTHQAIAIALEVAVIDG